MSLPALRAVRQRYPRAEIAILALDWVADLYHREEIGAEIIVYPARRGARDLRAKHELAKQLGARGFDAAILFQNALEAALVVWHAGIPVRAGYNRDGRGMLLTHAVEVPRKGTIPAHESYYYLEMLRQLGVVETLPDEPLIRLAGREAAREAGQRFFRERGFAGGVVGVSPGAAYGTAKRWFPERFAEAASLVARETGASVALFGSKGERELCETVAAQIQERGVESRNLAGETKLREFIDMTAGCEVMLTNDSGAMHIASAMGTPTVTVFGATDWIATAPTGPLARIVRHEIECAPCLKRECPLGHHRCMELVSAREVARTALELLK